MPDDITFPSSVGTVVRGIRAFLTGTGWSGAKAVTTQPRLPDAPHRTARMVTVRDDGGTPRNGVSLRRHGFNIWADDPVEAETLAIDVADCCRSSFAAVEVSDPIDVTDEDDAAMRSGMFHYFVSAVLVIRASNL